MYEELIIFPALGTLKIFNREEKYVYNQISCYQNTIKRAINKKLLLYFYYVPNGYYPGKVFTSPFKLLSFFAGNYQKTTSF